MKLILYMAWTKKFTRVPIVVAVPESDPIHPGEAALELALAHYGTDHAIELRYIGDAGPAVKAGHVEPWYWPTPEKPLTV